eukprot:3888863-Prymnesium_polylepis.1
MRGEVCVITPRSRGEQIQIHAAVLPWLRPHGASSGRGAAGAVVGAAVGAGDVALHAPQLTPRWKPT